MSIQIASVDNTIRELIKHNESQIAVLNNQRARHIQNKQSEYYEAHTKQQVLELNSLLKEALAELEAAYNRDKAALDAKYAADKDAANKSTEQKRIKLISEANESVALTEGIAFDQQIARIQEAIKILKGGDM